VRTAFIIELLGEDGVWRSEGEHYGTLYATGGEAAEAMQRMRNDGAFDIGAGALPEDHVRITVLKMPSQMAGWLVRDGAVFLGIISAPDDDGAMEISIALAVNAGIEYSETLTWERLS
jgi:hypothetical protein